MKKIDKFDVIIVGGGTSGCSCAYNCAKNGLKTLLIEKNNFLGGLMTGGLVIPIMKSSTKNFNTDYYKKLIDTSKKYNSQITYSDDNDGWLNPEMLKIILDDVLSCDEVKNNLTIYFESEVVGVKKKENKLTQVQIKSNLLSISIESHYFVDATGSAEFSKLCGCEFLNDCSSKQQNSLRFILGNVDIETFCKFIKEIDNDEDITNTYRYDLNNRNELHFTTASTWDTNKIWALDKILKKGVETGILKDEDRSYFQIFSVAGTTSQVAFNCPRFDYVLDDIASHSQALIEARKAIYRLITFVKAYFPGFENSILCNIATITGIREQNRVKTKYIYKKEDILKGTTFENPVLEAQYPIDIHSKDKNTSTLNQIGIYQLPIEALMSFDFDNLFVIGKILGAEFEAHSALRVQKSCMSMAEAVSKKIASMIN